MKPTIHDASARQPSGGPLRVPGRGSNRNGCTRKPGVSDLEAEIAGLIDRPTQELRLAWREFHRAGPPVGLSRDLLIRALPIICKSAPMAARGPRCAVAFGC